MLIQVISNILGYKNSGCMIVACWPCVRCMVAACWPCVCSTIAAPPLNNTHVLVETPFIPMAYLLLTGYGKAFEINYVQENHVLVAHLSYEMPYLLLMGYVSAVDELWRNPLRRAIEKSFETNDVQENQSKMTS